MHDSHAGAVVVVLFIVILGASVVMAVLHRDVKLPVPSPPETQTYFQCKAPYGENGCVEVNSTDVDPNAPLVFKSNSQCKTACAAVADGFCEWTVANGYTGRCTRTGPNDGVKLPTGSSCAKEGSFNTVCNARLAAKTQTCDGHHCVSGKDNCCVTDPNTCVTLSCCVDGTVQSVKYKNDKSCQKTCFPTTNCGKGPPDDMLTYYFTDKATGLCKETFVNFKNGEYPLPGTSPDLATACPDAKNVWWKLDVGKSCVGKFATTSPGSQWQNGVATACGATQPNRTGWCFLPPSNPLNPHCYNSRVPDPETCTGGYQFLTDVQSCPNTTIKCPSGTLPQATPGEVLANCCPYGAVTPNGDSNWQDAPGRCLPIPKACMCWNDPAKPGDKTWDGETFSKCEFGCSQSPPTETGIIIQCLTDKSGDGTNDGSMCVDGQCVCRFPTKENECGSDTFTVATCAGGGNCTSPGCIGCGYSTETSAPTCSWSDSMPGCSALMSDFGDETIYVCPTDGSDCGIGDSDTELTKQLDRLQRQKPFGDYCSVERLTHDMRKCVNDPSTACVKLSEFLPSSSLKGCRTYNSLLRVSRDDFARATNC